MKKSYIPEINPNKYGAEDFASQSEWISVEDRLPVPLSDIEFYGGMEILVVVDGKTETCDFSYGPLPKPWVKFGSFHNAYVTHWMPLPKPPTQ